LGERIDGLRHPSLHVAHAGLAAIGEDFDHIFVEEDAQLDALAGLEFETLRGSIHGVIDGLVAGHFMMRFFARLAVPIRGNGSG
jgi:hypothetical protein